MKISSFVLLVSTLLFSGGNGLIASSVFTFEANAPNTATPFTDTLNGLSATFSGKASVCNSDGLFQSLSGNVLVQQICGPATESGPFYVLFSENLAGIKLDFATVGGPSTLTLTAFENATIVGSFNFISSVPSGLANGEGLASFSETFNRLSFTANTLLAIDNINALTTAPVPKPAPFSMVLAGAALLAAFARCSYKCKRGAAHSAPACALSSL